MKQGLAVHLASFFYQRQPRWFLIGLAQFLETMRLSADGKTATLGDINLQGVREYNTHRITTVEDALGWGNIFNPHDEATLSGLYGLSWLMVHFLYNTHPDEFARFQTLLAKGVDPDKAWKLAFPKLSTGELDKELNHFARYGEYRNASIPVPEVDSTIHQHSMTSADVHATRAATALAADKGKEAAEELAAALAVDPDHPQALRLQLPLIPAQARVPLGRRAIAAHPEDGWRGSSWPTHCGTGQKTGRRAPRPTGRQASSFRTIRKPSPPWLGWTYRRANRVRRCRSPWPR